MSISVHFKSIFVKQAPDTCRMSNEKQLPRLMKILSEWEDAARARKKTAARNMRNSRKTGNK